MNYREALAWLYDTQRDGIKLGLGAMHRLASGLGLDLTGERGPQFLHVAGTNGKGSVCALLDSILRASGRRTGLCTSPHLITFRERIAVDGELIAKEAMAEGLSRIRTFTEADGRCPTFFEVSIALALLHFQESEVEFVVLETGMGGRLDATNIVTPRLSILTPIDLDHQQWLGQTLPEIAMEKAGIIKPGRPAISAPQHDEVMQILAHTAVERGCSFSLVVSPLNGAPLRLAGEHQRWNAALAVHALDAAEVAISNEALVQGLATVRWPGRFQRVREGDLVLDGAHNSSAATELRRTWRAMYGKEQATLVLGTMRDKDIRGICAALAPLARRILVTPVRSPRSAAPENVVAILREIAPVCEAEVAKDLSAALEVALGWEERVLVAGSLFLVGEALALLRGEPLEAMSAQ